MFKNREFVKPIICFVLGAYLTIALGQVYLGEYKPSIDVPENRTVYYDNKNFEIVTDGYLYQFPGADPNYHGNYRMAIVRDKMTRQEHIIIFNDRAITAIERNISK